MKIDSGKKIAPSFYISAITHKFAWVCAEAQQGTWKHQFCALLCTCVGNSAEYDRSYYCLLIGCHVQSVEPVVCVCVCVQESESDAEEPPRTKVAKIVSDSDEDEEEES